MEGEGAASFGLTAALEPTSLQDNVFKSTERVATDTIEARNDDQYFAEDEFDDEDTLDNNLVHSTNILNINTSNLQPLTVEELLIAQNEDKECQDIRKRIAAKETMEFTEDERNLIIRLAPIDHSRQIYTPKSLRSRLLLLAHYPRSVGHPGGTRMYQTLRRTFYWPSMALDVFHTVRQCSACAKERVSLRRHARFLKLFPAKQPLEFVSIDILGPLPRSQSGNKYLLVISDRYSKYTKTVLLRSISSWTVAKAFCEHWAFVFGPPKLLLSDNGGQFMSKFFQSVCNILGTRNLFTTAYHPQTNGQVERYNHTILAGLRHYCAEHGRDWDNFSSAITFGYNNTVHRATNLTPAQLVLTVPPITLALPHADPIDFEELNTFARKKRFHTRLRNLMKTADKQLKAHQKRYKEDFDKLVKERDLDLKPGCLVFLRRDTPTDKDEHGNTTNLKSEHNLRSKALGPYEVVKVDSHTLSILQDGLLQTVSRDRIVRAPDPPPMPDLDDEEDNTATTEDVVGYPQPTDDGTTLDPDDVAKTTPIPQTSEPETSKLQSTDPNESSTPSQTDNQTDPKPATPDISYPSTNDQPTRRSQRLRKQKNATQSSQTVPMVKPAANPFAFDQLVDLDEDSDTYRVRWTNYTPDDDTWEPPANLPYNAVRNFHKRKRWRIPAYIPGRYID